MPTTILDGETYFGALQRRYAEEAQKDCAMTQDEIIAMAREAGAEFYAETLCVNGKDAHDFIERFAALVRADERDKCAKVCEELNWAYCGEYAAAIRSMK